MTTFIAVDGEADAQGNYILLCDSTGRTYHNPRGISTREALQFLLELPRRTEIMCYGLNYDANQWVRDLPKPALTALASEGACSYLATYALSWIPSKMFILSVPGKTVTVCEAFGFFQTSFVKALRSWGLEPPREMEVMKGKRGSFTGSELERVKSYCLEECRMLVTMMDRLCAACETARCKPKRRWIGAGAIASSLLTRNQIKGAHQYDADLFGRELTDDYVLRAYFGGRVELYRQGWHDHAISSDIRSAYPAAATELPSLSDASVHYTRHYRPDAPYALWRVRWNCGSNEQQIAPFPTRLASGQIAYPYSGTGVYHASEVTTAIALGYPVTILDGVVITPRDPTERPFAWIPDVFAQRQKFQAEGSYAEKALKLGLNSCYGKMAQGYGFGRRPPFQSYYWAGYITAMTRARALGILAASDAPIMCSTDGVVTLDGKAVAGNGLGDWEVTEYDRLGTVQPGVYVIDSNGERKVKSRGFFARDVDYDQLLIDWDDDHFGAYYYKSRRFIGLKVALHRKDFSVWRTWPDERRSIAFEVNNKISTVAGEHVLLYPPPGPYESLPYVPKQSLYDDPSEPSEFDIESMVRDDQPHREVD